MNTKRGGWSGGQVKENGYGFAVLALVVAAVVCAISAIKILA